MKTVAPNPFEGLIGPIYSPFSAILRADFLTRMLQTFIVFFGMPTGLIHGGHTSEKNRDRAGVLDYLSVGILTLPVLLFAWCLRNDNVVAKLLFVPASIVMGVSVLIRLIAAALLTLLMLPILAVVHGIVYFSVKDDFKNVLKLPVHLADDPESPPISLEECCKSSQKMVGAKIELYEVLYGDTLSVSKDAYHLIGEHFAEDLFYISSQIGTTLEQRRAQHALLRLNLFGFTVAAEEAGNDSLLTADWKALLIPERQDVRSDDKTGTAKKAVPHVPAGTTHSDSPIAPPHTSASSQPPQEPVSKIYPQ